MLLLSELRIIIFTAIVLGEVVVVIVVAEEDDEEEEEEESTGSTETSPSPQQDCGEELWQLFVNT